MSALIIDTETNGAEVPEIIELAYMDLAKTLTYCSRFKPRVMSNFGALSIHHILPEELEDCPPSLEARLPRGYDYIIGHNIDYDWTALGKPPFKRICTLAIARRLYPEVDSHRLGSMYYRLFGALPTTREVLKNAHSAAADAKMCGDLLDAMIRDRAPEQYHESVDSLWKFSEDCRLLPNITFGKHKGMALIDLPREYVQWCRRQPDMDPYFIKALDKFRGGK